MKTAAASATKWQGNSGNGAQNYVSGAQNTTKDQAALAIAAKGNYAAGVQAAITAGSFEKGLGKSGKQGWLAGVQQKGAQNYGTGVSSPAAHSKYAANSGAYDSARGAAANIARGPKGAAGNIARVSAVVAAERAIKMGK